MAMGRSTGAGARRLGLARALGFGQDGCDRNCTGRVNTCMHVYTVGRPDPIDAGPRSKHPTGDRVNQMRNRFRWYNGVFVRIALYRLAAKIGTPNTVECVDHGYGCVVRQTMWHT